MRSNKHIIASVLLVLFCILQFAELHELDSDHDHSECSLCLLHSDLVNDDFIIVPGIDIPEPFEVPTYLAHTNCINNYFDSSFDNLPLNKAPPIL